MARDIVRLPPLPPERERLIREMYVYYQTGANLQQVGARFGFSGERVRQLFARLDLPRRKGGRGTVEGRQGTGAPPEIRVRSMSATTHRGQSDRPQR